MPRIEWRRPSYGNRISRSADLSGGADIQLGSEKQVVVAPAESIFRDGSDGPSFVLVQTPSGFEKHQVELGLASNTAVAVRSGLRPGEVVALMRPVSGEVMAGSRR